MKKNQDINSFSQKESESQSCKNSFSKSAEKFFCVNSSKIPRLSRCLVQVEFIEGLSIEQVTEEINQLLAPQIIVWYIGCYGLRKTGVQFYKESLISPVFKENVQATFWLVDLTGWNAFKNASGSIYKANSCTDTIESFLDARIKCIRSSKIFKKMQNLDKELTDYFQKAVLRDFIREPSKNFSDRSILVGEIFSNDCPVMANWFDCDASKSYSAFQYLEGCLFIEEVFMDIVSSRSTNHIQIVFPLPNDELKYYRDANGSFEKDVNFLISKRCNELNIDTFDIQITFLAFKYGSHEQHRPYNAPGCILKKNDLSLEDVTGYGEQIKNPTLEVPYARI